MSDSATTAGVDLRGYPVVTRREAHALVRASEALGSIVDRGRRDAYSGRADAARDGAITSERAAVARDAISALLIAAKVYGGSETAGAALERV